MAKLTSRLGDVFGGLTVVAAVAAIVSVLPAWITHIVHCFQNDEYFFLIAGAIMPPIGIIHGWGIWFGWW